MKTKTKLTEPVLLQENKSQNCKIHRYVDFRAKQQIFCCRFILAVTKLEENTDLDERLLSSLRCYQIEYTS